MEILKSSGKKKKKIWNQNNISDFYLFAEWKFQ